MKKTDETENTTETGEVKGTPEKEGAENVPETEGAENVPETEGAENVPETKETEDVPETEDTEGMFGIEGDEEGIVTVSGNGAAEGGMGTKGFLFLGAGIIIVLIMVFLGITFQKKLKKQKKEMQTPEDLTEKEQAGTEEIIVEWQAYRVGKLHCVGRRESQQDSFAVSDVEDAALCGEKGVIVIVADGMGGLSDGDKISSMVTLSFFRHFHERAMQGGAGNALLQMLQEANEEVNRYLGNKTGQCGSTLVAGIVKDKKCCWISVGDSHIYLYKNGGLVQLNREHVYREELDTKAANGEISREEAMRNPQRGALTSYIGMGRIEKVDRNQEPLVLCSGDRLLFMTDGVFGTLTEGQIAEAMRYPIDESIRLMDESIRAVGKPKQDNYTAVVLECI